MSSQSPFGFGVAQFFFGLLACRQSFDQESNLILTRDGSILIDSFFSQIMPNLKHEHHSLTCQLI